MPLRSRRELFRLLLANGEPGFNRGFVSGRGAVDVPSAYGRMHGSASREHRAPREARTGPAQEPSGHKGVGAAAADCDGPPNWPLAARCSVSKLQQGNGGSIRGKVEGSLAPGRIGQSRNGSRSKNLHYRHN